MNKIYKNEVVLRGTVTRGVEEVYSKDGDTFYKFYIGIIRYSGTMDELPVLVRKSKLYNLKKYPDVGDTLKIEGEYRSYNIDENGINRLKLYVVPHYISDIEETQLFDGITNNIDLQGCVCQNRGLRLTPLGKRITDIMVAVNRKYGKSSYIPCIIWGLDEESSANLKVGNFIKITGRIQSREYNKGDEEGNIINKTAYEVSVREFSTE